MEQVIRSGESAQITATIEYVPETLFFNLPNSCWMKGHLMLGGTRIGTSDCHDFTKEELQTMHEIVKRATMRHHISLKNYGNI